MWLRLQQQNQVFMEACRSFWKALAVEACSYFPGDSLSGLKFNTILHLSPLHSIVWLFLKVFFRSFPCLVTTWRNFIFSFNPNQIMLNCIFFIFKWEGEGSNNSPYFKKPELYLHSEKQHPQQPEHANSRTWQHERVWWRKKATNAKSDEKLSHTWKATQI